MRGAEIVLLVIVLLMLGLSLRLYNFDAYVFYNVPLVLNNIHRDMANNQPYQINDEHKVFE